MFYVYTCPICNLIVRRSDESTELKDIKACGCEAEPVLTLENVDA